MSWFKKYDVLTKAIALLLSIVLWFYVVSTNDVKKDYKVRDISPTFIGIEELATSKNLILVGEHYVDVEISGKRRDLVSLNKSDIRVEVDLSNITSAGTYELPYTVNLPSSSYKLLEKDPQRLTVKFDEESIRTVPVRLVTDDITADGYILDKSNIKITPAELRLTGLREEVDNVAYAEVNTLKKDIRGTTAGKYEYRLYDFNDELITSADIEADYDMVDVNIPVLKIKEVPLSLEVQGNDALKKYVNYKIEPERINVAGEESIVDQITSIDVGAVKITEISSGMKKDYTITPPAGIIVFSDELTASAEITVEGLSKKTINTSLIELVNVSTLMSDQTIELQTNNLNVEILGSDDALAKVNSNNVRAVVDLESTFLSKATHTLNATIIVDGVSDVIVSNPNEYFVYVEVS